jgi:hypothetical protein
MGILVQIADFRLGIQSAEKAAEKYMRHDGLFMVEYAMKPV